MESRQPYLSEEAYRRTRPALAKAQDEKRAAIVDDFMRNAEARQESADLLGRIQSGSLFDRLTPVKLPRRYSFENGVFTELPALPYDAEQAERAAKAHRELMTSGKVIDPPQGEPKMMLAFVNSRPVVAMFYGDRLNSFMSIEGLAQLRQITEDEAVEFVKTLPVYGEAIYL